MDSRKPFWRSCGSRSQWSLSGPISFRVRRNGRPTGAWMAEDWSAIWTSFYPTGGKPWNCVSATFSRAVRVDREDHPRSRKRLQVLEILGKKKSATRKGADLELKHRLLLQELRRLPVLGLPHYRSVSLRLATATRGK